MGSPNSIDARIKNFSKTFFTPLPVSCDEFLKSQIHQALGFVILCFFGKTIYNNHENTKEGKHEIYAIKHDKKKGVPSNLNGTPFLNSKI